MIAFEIFEKILAVTPEELPKYLWEKS